MRKLILAAMIALIGFGPASGFAQTPPAVKPPPPAASAPAAAVHTDDTSRVLAIGLGAISGMVVLTVLSANMISRAALANLGQGALVFIGTVVGGLTGNWFYTHDYQ
ncbi:MAG: hypothetical protein WCJ64_13745 [Rhodospirillaceae bacterium]